MCELSELTVAIIPPLHKGCEVIYSKRTHTVMNEGKKKIHRFSFPQTSFQSPAEGKTRPRVAAVVPFSVKCE